MRPCSPAAWRHREARTCIYAHAAQLIWRHHPAVARSFIPIAKRWPESQLLAFLPGKPAPTPRVAYGQFADRLSKPAHPPSIPREAVVNADRALLGRLLMLLAAAFFIWAALRSAGIPGQSWLIPGGLAAWVLALAIG